MVKQIENKFYKIKMDGFSFITALFYNPVTKETKTEVADDLDDAGKYNPEVYNMPIDEDVLKIYQHDNGIILEGDYARVVKGRTIEHGFVGLVTKIKRYYDRYDRYLADYIYFDDGRKINMNNCELVMEEE